MHDGTPPVRPRCVPSHPFVVSNSAPGVSFSHRANARRAQQTLCLCYKHHEWAIRRRHRARWGAARPAVTSSRRVPLGGALLAAATSPRASQVSPSSLAPQPCPGSDVEDLPSPQPSNASPPRERPSASAQDEWGSSSDTDDGTAVGVERELRIVRAPVWPGFYSSSR